MPCELKPLLMESMFQSIHPFTGQVTAQFKPLSDRGLEQKVCLASQLFQQYRTESLSERLSCVLRLTHLLQNHKQDLASLITQEMGKPLVQSLREIEKSLSLCEYMVKVAPRVLADSMDLPLAPPSCGIVYQPLGVVLGIMPWNFPVWQVMRFALPTLLSGNTALVKPAPNVMGTSEKLSQLFQKAFEKEVYQHLPISLEQTQGLIADSRIRGVSLTGSVRAGRAVAALAGRHLKKTVLELGGSDPYIVLDDADLKLAARQCVLSRMNNNGQSCIAAKRFIITKKKAGEWIPLVLKEMQTFQAGDPTLPSTRLGPLARRDLRDQLQAQVGELQNRGAKLLSGGDIKSPLLPQKGWFYPPTVLTSDQDKVFAYKGELFGPVALILQVQNEEEALQVANSSPYGLGSAVFSRDLKRARAMALRLETGSCAINQCLHSHPALPFGGVKDSGYGRELSPLGFYEFMNIKTLRL